MKPRHSSLSICVIMLCMVHSALAQESPIFTWLSQASYNNVTDIAPAGNLIYAASPNGLFFVDLSENSVNRLDKNDGLSGVSIGAIAYDENLDLLVVGYANGNIDIISATEITNVKTVLEAPTTIEKGYSSIQVKNGFAYLSGKLGIVVLDLILGEIVESYQNIGENGENISISEIAFLGDSLYAASEKGILSASLNAEVNRQDFNNWNRTFTGISFSQIASTQGSLFASSQSDLFSYESGEWNYEASTTTEIRDIENEQATPFLLTSSGIFSYQNQAINAVYQFPTQNTFRNRLVIHQNKFWVGDSFQGLLRIDGNEQQTFKPSGPATDKTWLLGGWEESIIQLPGGFSDQLTPLNRPPFYSTFNWQQGWRNFPVVLSNGDSINDLVDFELLPQAGISQLYLASFSKGLFKVSSEEITPLSEISPNTTLNLSSLKITAMAQKDGSLWVTNYGQAPSLHQWDFTQNEWKSYATIDSHGQYPNGLFIFENGDKWIPISPERGGGIVVFNEQTGKERYLNTNGGQGGLPGNTITSFAVDENQFLWMGTNGGICFFPNAYSVLEGTALTASIPIFENRLLLRDEYITTVAIDPANRKWFGTKNNGLWLFSETGEELIQRFTSENSPLPSNSITAMHIDEQNGEVYIGTEKGLVSFRSDATKGTSVHQNVKIYPNPVPPNFSGEIVINGLVNNAYVKVTDVAGHLIKGIRANGSTAIWNARDINGGKVKTGIYLVFSSNADGTETYVGKIAVI